MEHVSRIVAVAPFRDDALHLRALLEGDRISLECLATSADLSAALGKDPDLVLLTQEALTPTLVDELKEFARNQPPWSDVPIILLTDAHPATLAFLKDVQADFADHNLSILHRPVRRGELTSAVRFALAARRRQLELRDHLDFQEQLKRELSHRVKNILANVSALFFMTLRQVSNLEELVPAFQGRLDALSRVHGLLVATEWTQSDVGAVAENVLSPYRDVSGVRISIEGPRQQVSPGSAVTLGLALHELATNASKYGALSKGEGRLALRWHGDPTTDRMILTWNEMGGPPVEVPSRSGFGTRFIQSVIERSLGGETQFQWHHEGLECVFRIPVAALERK